MSTAEYGGLFKQLTLAEIAATFSPSDTGFNYFHGKLFSLLVPSINDFVRFSKELKLPDRAMPNSHPARVLIGDLSNLVPYQQTIVPSIKDGGLLLLLHISERKLPECMYLAIISPALKTGTSTSYSEAFKAIHFTRTLLALHFGKLASYTWIADFDFDREGKLSFPGETIRNPLYADFFQITDLSLADEITARLSTQQPHYRVKFQTACDFVNYALNQRDEAFRFSSYWIALEVLVGKSGAVRAKLAQAYGMNPAFVDSELCFKEIAGIRHSLIHSGTFGILRAYQERLLQLYFWDIARHQMNLPCRQLARALIESGIVDEERAAITSRKQPSAMGPD